MYVISVLRTKDYFFNPLKKEEYRFEYLKVDTSTSTKESFSLASTSFALLTSYAECTKFRNIEEAEKAFNAIKDTLRKSLGSWMDIYEWDWLAIRQPTFDHIQDLSIED